MSIRFDPRYGDVAKTDILSLQNLALNIVKQPNMRMNNLARVSKKNQTKYFEGVASSFELREAQLQLYSTQNNYIKAIQNVIQKKLALETLLNTPQQ